jgi:hypothetical protein
VYGELFSYCIVSRFRRSQFEMKKPNAPKPIEWDEIHCNKMSCGGDMTTSIGHTAGTSEPRLNTFAGPDLSPRNRGLELEVSK